MKIKTLDFGKNETLTPMNNKNCVNCSECCTYMLILTDIEYKNIMNLIKKDRNLKNYINEKLIKTNHDLQINQTFDFKCIFSDENKKCKIYDNRPYVCKWFHCDNKSQVLPLDFYHQKNIHVLSDLIIEYIDKFVFIPEIYIDVKNYLKNVINIYLSNKTYDKI